MVNPSLVDASRMSEGKKKKKWMKKAFENAHGQFKAKAEHAGESTSEFAHEHEHSKGLLGKQSRLAEMGMHAHKRHFSGKHMRKQLYGSKE